MLRRFTGCTCTASGTATYRMTFTATWTDPTPPTNFPHWSAPIGTSHSACYTMWRNGILSSPGMKIMAELGGTSTLKNEFTAQGAQTLSTFQSGGIGSASGTSTTTFTVDRYHPLASVATMIAPSPDWFVGAYSENLCDGSSWKQSLVVQAFPWDAGTDSGLDWNSANQATSPAQTIARITETSPRTSVYRKTTGTTTSMGNIRFDLVSTNTASSGTNPQCSMCATTTTVAAITTAAPAATTTPAPAMTTTLAPAMTTTPAPAMTTTPAPAMTTTPAQAMTTTLAPAMTTTPAPAVTTIPMLIGGCAGTQYGCCPDGTTAASGPNQLGCPSAPTSSAQGSTEAQSCGCMANGTATYHMTFTATWTDPTPPTSFPHWSWPIGTSHSACYTMWKGGILSSPGMRSMAEVGTTGTLKNEFAAQGANTRSTFQGNFLGSASGTSTASFTADRYRPLVSVATMIAPSPDWFVGAYSENLCDGSSWKQSVTVQAYPWDAGTDSGVSWNSGNQVTTPAQPIARITATSLRTTVYRKASGSTASMGTITFDLVSTSATDDADVADPSCSTCAAPTPSHTHPFSSPGSSDSSGATSGTTIIVGVACFLAGFLISTMIFVCIIKRRAQEPRAETTNVPVQFSKDIDMPDLKENDAYGIRTSSEGTHYDTIR
ncbi:mucin-5AC-like [Sycon ciliatum]|uniref:mucin-5AC-like n=1 Tax=Sycon ciliatum TaxID=27933 RepID=UPI0031F672EA